MSEGRSLRQGTARQIEALCGVVILLTMVSSYTGGYDRLIGHLSPLPATVSLGFLSLQMFLAIAAMQWVHEIAGQRGWARYGAARLTRFLPAVFPAVLASYCIGSVTGLAPLQADLSALLANLAMVADFIGLGDFHGAFWRLKIEVMFSVGLGLVWFGLGARAAVATLACGLLQCAWGTHGEPVHGAGLSAAGLLTMDGYLPQLTFGIALYHLSERRHVALWRLLAGISAALVLVSNSLGHGVLVLAAFGVIALAAHGRLPWLARLGWLVSLGRVFFPVFLLHQVLGFALIHAIEARGGSPLAAIGAACALATAGGFLVHRYFMLPAQAQLPVWLGQLTSLLAKPRLAQETAA